MLATFVVSLPSLTIMLLITKFYMVLHNNRYVRDAMYGMLPMVVAMILAATHLLLLLTPDTFIDVYSWLILAAAFSLRSKMNPILVICLSGVVGYLLYGLVRFMGRFSQTAGKPGNTQSVIDDFGFPTYPGVCNRRLSGEVLSGNRRNRAGWRVGRFPCLLVSGGLSRRSLDEAEYLLKFPVW